MEMAIVSIFFLTFFIIICMISLAASVLTIVGEWKVFEKAGKPGWASIIPYYNQWILYELGDFSPFLIFLSVGLSILSFIASFMAPFMEYNRTVIPFYIVLNIIVILLSIIVIVINILVSINIAKKFNKSAGFGVGLALLPYIFYPILGFDKKAEYNKEAK